MDTSSKRCRICGKSVQGTYICEDCEKEVHAGQRGGRIFLSLTTGGLLILVAYFIFRTYSAEKGNINLAPLFGSIMGAFSFVLNIISSPFVFLPLVILLLIVAFLLSAKIAK